ncbi:MAG: hypothetical protein IIZ29_06855 [Schwartzia sp.]|nr:hypothetical protein [Schwartzia sp. (in: firmicutes)]
MKTNIIKKFGTAVKDTQAVCSAAYDYLHDEHPFAAEIASLAGLLVAEYVVASAITDCMVWAKLIKNKKQSKHG